MARSIRTRQGRLEEIRDGQGNDLAGAGRNGSRRERKGLPGNARGDRRNQGAPLGEGEGGAEDPAPSNPRERSSRQIGHRRGPSGAIPPRS